MIIEYRIRNRSGESCICCGQFRDSQHWLAFIATEAFAARIVSHPVVLSPAQSAPLVPAEEKDSTPLPGCAECGWNDEHAPQCSMRGTLAPPASALPRAKQCPSCTQTQLMALTFCGHCGVRYDTPIYKNPNCNINHPGSSCNVACGDY